MREVIVSLGEEISDSVGSPLEVVGLAMDDCDSCV